MASSGFRCISRTVTVPNIRRGIPLDGRRPSEEFHSICVSRKASRNWSSRTATVAGRSNSWIPAISASTSPNHFGGSMMSSDVVSNDDDAVVFKQHSPSTLPTIISPWLMLPPAFENQNMMVYKFYSLKDDKVLSINKRDPSSGVEARDDEPSDDSELVGSSHGWLVLYNRRNLDLFLSNPLSRRHIKLPPIHNLPGIPKRNLESGFGCVESVILSSPPNGEDCRAIMIYGPTESSLAFCCPGLGGTQWTPISKHFGDPLDSCVYSSTQKLFFCVNKYFDFEVLDVRDPSSPKCFPMERSELLEDEPNWRDSSDEDWLLKRYLCHNINFLVVAEPNSTADLLVVSRHTMIQMYPCGASAAIKTLTVFDYHYGTTYPYKTIDFTVHKYDPDKKAWKYMDGSLDGLAIFIGNNHSFAMRASDFPELKPNSIYFTDVTELIYYPYGPDACNFGGHDIGIYNYKDKTLSPCYYPCDVQSIKRIEPAPLWFTPLIRNF